MSNAPANTSQPRVGDLLFTLKIGGKDVSVPQRLHMRQGVQFRGKKPRPASPDSILVHDNAGGGHPAEFLDSKGLGVHFIVELDGKVWVGGDPVLDQLNHGGSWNARSIGVELRQPFSYEGRHALQTEFIAKTHLAGNKPLPMYPDAQLVAFAQLVEFLQDSIPTLARDFPAVAGGVPLHKPAKTGAGVVAHHHTFPGHADGTIPIAVAYYLRQGRSLEDAKAQVARDLGSSLQPIPPDQRGPFKPLGPSMAPPELRCPGGACKPKGGGGGGKKPPGAQPPAPDTDPEPAPGEATEDGLGNKILGGLVVVVTVAGVVTWQIYKRLKEATR